MNKIDKCEPIMDVDITKRFPDEWARINGIQIRNLPAEENYLMNEYELTYEEELDFGNYIIESYKNKIETFLKAHNKKAMLEKDLASKCRSRKGNPDNYKKAVHELQREGVIIFKKQNKSRFS